MPYKITKSKRTGLYRVTNIATGQVHAHGTTRAKAESQLRLLESLEGRYKKKKT